MILYSDNTKYHVKIYTQKYMQIVMENTMFE